jgi:C4-dicarboxylate-specific signal transduction histidine kinase
VRNALEATREAGPGRPAPRVGYEATRPDRVALVVRDWGKGLRTTNPRALIRLAAGRAGGRKGTGLVTVERIARLQGGDLEFAAAPDGGAEVRLTLPAA